jgi:hypothetical protein
LNVSIMYFFLVTPKLIQKSIRTAANVKKI